MPRVGVDRVHGAALVGRDREVALLEDALARTLGERSPQLVTLVGVPGIGKSRLVLELYGAIERHPDLISWRHGRCLPYGEGVTFWALGEMVKAQAGILDGDDEAEAARKLSDAVSDPWIESHLRPLVGLAGGAEPSGDARDEAFTAWRRFFEGLADERPLVLVFEDLHWADDHLLDFVDHLVEWSAGVPLLVVGTARPELLTRRPGWGGGKPNALTVSLSPLSDDETATLLHELLGSVLPAETQLQLLGRAGGNPLYAEEFARMLRDRGGEGEIPETVQGLIAARIDLLEPDEKALLQDAAVIGKRFWTGALVSFAGIDAAGLEQRLHALERRGVRASRASELGRRRERVRLPPPARPRRRLRADPARRARRKAPRDRRWIEQLGRREDHAEMLAHHYLQALELTAATGGAAAAFAGAAREALTDAGERAFALQRVRRRRALLPGCRRPLSPRTTRAPGCSSASVRRSSTSASPTRACSSEPRPSSSPRGTWRAPRRPRRCSPSMPWMTGDRDSPVEALDAALELATGLPVSPGEGACDLARLAVHDARRASTRSRSVSARRRSRWRRSWASRRFARRR